ncbi:MAG: restriction endonuclease subunit S [Veillonella sp.]|nr:restriction endonuclease subunit S [Veillonella sp.]
MLAELCDKGSSSLAQKDLVFNSGIYPVYGASGEITKVDFFHQSKPYLGLIKDGAGVGRVMQLPANSSVIGTIQYIFPRENVDLRYLYYLIKYLELGKSNTGATIPHIYFKDYKKRKVKFRAYSEQRHIGQILELIDNQLTTYNNILEQYDLLIKSRFVEIFGNPIINDKKYPVFKLKDISQKIGSGVTPRGGDSNYIDKGVAFIRSMNVYNNTFKKDNLVYIDKSLAKQLSQVELFSNDLLLNITGASVARCCIVPDDILPARVNQHVCIIRQCRISNVFLEYCLTNESYQEYLLLLSNKNGATREALTKAQVENLEVIFPPLTEITRFVRLVHQINKLKFA